MVFAQELITRILWALAPLGFGLYVWLFNQGPLSTLDIPYTLQALAMASGLTWGLWRMLEYARKEYAVRFFEYRVVLPPWFLFGALTLASLILRWMFIPSGDSAVNSLIMGVFTSAYIEELVGHSLFVYYPMSGMQAVAFNSVSSLAFSFMHAGFESPPAPLLDYLLARGHFIFSFTLGLIAYKTRRIELTIILHMLSNFVHYTLPVLILKHPSAPPLLSLALSCLTLLAVAGCYYEPKRTTSIEAP